MLLGLALVRLRGGARPLDDLIRLRAGLVQALAVFGEQLLGLGAGALGRVDRLFDRQLAPFQRLAVAQTPSLAAAATAATPLTGAQQGQPPQPANPGVEDTRGALNRQLPAAAGLLLALSLLNGTGAVPPPAPKQPEIN